MRARDAGLLTDGSPYSPTPSQRVLCQWRMLLAFVPAHSGASVRDFHPLPGYFVSLARVASRPRACTIWHGKCQVWCRDHAMLLLAAPSRLGSVAGSVPGSGLPAQSGLTAACNSV
jgi:hypothetical protein